MILDAFFSLVNRCTNIGTSSSLYRPNLLIHASGHILLLEKSHNSERTLLYSIADINTFIIHRIYHHLNLTL